jgi:alkylhydroperoxidase family enzyme
VLDEALVPFAQYGDVSNTGFTARERLAIRYADLMHRTPGAMTTAFMDELRAEFTDPEIVELGLAVAQFIGMGQLIHMLGIPNPAVVPFDDVQ